MGLLDIFHNHHRRRHIWKFVTLAYIPPTIAGIVLAYRGRYLAGAAMAAFFAMMQLNANHIQMTYYFCFVIAIMVIAYLVQALRQKNVKRWGIATASLAVAAGLAVCANLPSIYHTSKYAKETQREQSEVDNNNPEQADAIKRAYITQYSYAAARLSPCLYPMSRVAHPCDPKADNWHRCHSPMSAAPNAFPTILT